MGYQPDKPIQAKVLARQTTVCLQGTPRKESSPEHCRNSLGNNGIAGRGRKAPGQTK